MKSPGDSTPPKLLKKRESFISKMFSFSSSKDESKDESPENTPTDSIENNNLDIQFKKGSKASPVTDDSIILANTASNSGNDVGSDSSPITCKRSSTLRSKLSMKLPTISFYKNSKNRVNNANSIMQLVAFAANDMHGKDDVESDKTNVKSNLLSARNAWHVDEEIDHSNQESFESIDRQDSSENKSISKDNEGNTANDIENDLQALFGLQTKEEFVTEHSCWFVGSILVQGNMYITRKSVLFHAGLPSFGRSEVKSGYLGKKSKKAPIAKYIKYWFVLRTNGIDLYEDSTKLYYPYQTIHFRSVKEIEVAKHTEFAFKIITGKNRYLFKADTELQMNEWLNAIKSARYNFQYSGDADVKVVLPFEAITDVFLRGDKSASDSIGIKTIDQEFYFCYFKDIKAVLENLRNLCKPGITFSEYQAVSNPSIGAENMARGDSSPPIWPNMSLDNIKQEEPIADPITLRPSPSSLELPSRKSTGDLDFPHGDIPRKTSKRSSWWRSGSRPDLEKQIPLDIDLKAEKSQRFCKLFGFPEDEELLFSSSCYFERTVPLIGKFYFSVNYLCFRTRLVGVQSRIVIPLSEVVSMAKEKSYFYYSISVRAENDEEFIFDLPTAEAQQTCLSLYKSKRQIAMQGISSVLTNQSADTRVSSIVGNLSKPAFKHITLLTIGTRGDVQPYIAFGKGLLAEGHTVRIATHLEYKEWVESFGIEFRDVKGDPADIMKLVVDNGLFTPSMIREYLLHFTGWIEDLLYSIADAIEVHFFNKGTDVLIESPSAIGGIHAAESKRIPYFNSFPFIWTKTKYYPHPFAILDRKTGGTYNWMTHVMAEQLMWKALRGIINRWRKDRLNLVAFFNRNQLDLALKIGKYHFYIHFPRQLCHHQKIGPIGFMFVDIGFWIVRISIGHHQIH